MSGVSGALAARLIRDGGPAIMRGCLRCWVIRYRLWQFTRVFSLFGVQCDELKSKI